MLVVGTFTSLKAIFPQIGEHAEKIEGDLLEGEQAFSFETNPDLMVWYNTRNGQWARGTWNCLNCAKRRQRPGNFDQCSLHEDDVTQQMLFAFDCGGCVDHEAGKLGTPVVGITLVDPSAEYDDLHRRIVEKNEVFVYEGNGRFRPYQPTPF